MTYITIAMLLAAAGLGARLGRLCLARELLRASNVLHAAGSRALDNVMEDHRHG
ncbi:hypothetical protein MesoLj131b_67270 [Mesorhizobium sp. 131-2-5]|uniref:hypothetical protein n=1 Tax=Mesorhizobium sp. 131-2-5 TaxID=2744519 RepID=UPI0019288B2B|nr:hypothetical protein [Mesorhizobium sp. 131-2-5]BCH04728.1 hypothetical protein MesoLj131b_67270 [Mesorhizobium sp. 131-2-5]